MQDLGRMAPLGNAPDAWYAVLHGEILCHA
jgi:hypothetical protein